MHHVQLHKHKQLHGWSSYNDAVLLYIDSTLIGSASIPMTGTNTRSLSGSLGVSPGNHTISVKMQCGDYQSCPINAHNNPITVGSITFYVPNPDVPPTNVQTATLYNHNGHVASTTDQAGMDKLDWDFYCTWSGHSAGTHTIIKQNLYIYKSDNLSNALATMDNVKQNTRYNFETLFPKCKVGEVYCVYINTLTDLGWLRQCKGWGDKII